MELKPDGERDRPASAISASGSRQRLGAIVARLTSANLLVMAFSLLTGPLLARSLGPSGRGAVAAVAAPMALAPYILGVGLPAFAAREAARDEPTGDLLGSVGLIYLVIGLIAIGLAEPVAGYFAQGREPVRIALLVIFYSMPVLLWGTLLLAIANGQQRWNTVLAARMIPAVIGLIGTVTLFVLGELGVSEALALILAGGLTSLIPTLGVLRGVRRIRVSGALMVRSIRFGVPAWLWQISSVTNNRLDQVLMVSLTSSRQLGLYAVAVTLASLSNQLSGAIGPALLPRVTKGNKTIVPRVSRATLLLTGLLNLLLAGISPLALPLLFGSKFSDAVPMAWLLAAAAVPSAGTQVLTAALLGAGRPRLVALSEMVSVAITVGGLLLLIGPLGGIGAALVSLAAYTVTFLILLVGARGQFEARMSAFLIPRSSELVEQFKLARSYIARARARGRSAPALPEEG